jgi:hypothetical protein
LLRRGSNGQKARAFGRLSTRITAESYNSDSRHEQELQEARHEIGWDTTDNQPKGGLLPKTREEAFNEEGASEGVSEFCKKVSAKEGCDNAVVVARGCWLMQRVQQQATVQDKVPGQGLHKPVVAGAVSPMRRELQEQPNGSKERAVDRRH